MKDKKSIIIADDDLDILEPMHDAFSRAGFDVLIANDGVEALRMLDTAGASVDVLLTDVDMPRMNGKDLARVIRSHHPGIKIVLMSGKTNDLIVNLGIPDGHLLCIRKPFTPASAVKAVLDEMR